MECINVWVESSQSRFGEFEFKNSFGHCLRGKENPSISLLVNFSRGRIVFIISATSCIWDDARFLTCGSVSLIALALLRGLSFFLFLAVPGPFVNLRTVQMQSLSKTCYERTVPIWIALVFNLEHGDLLCPQALPTLSISDLVQRIYRHRAAWEKTLLSVQILCQHLRLCLMNGQIFVCHLIIRRSHLHNIHRLLMTCERRFVLSRNLFVNFGGDKVAERWINVTGAVISQID